MASEEVTDDQRQWRESTARARLIWKGHIGGTYETLASALGDIGGAIPANSLAQCLRPKGRRPRYAADVLQRIATVLTTKLADRRPDMDAEAFEAAMRKHISGGATSPLDETPSPQPKDLEVSGVAQSAALFTFDIWTPGQPKSVFVEAFSPYLGPAGAEAVGELSRQAIDAIGAGDFHRQRDVAEQAILLGEAAPQTPLVGEGLYLKAEALRLIADTEADRAVARGLRREAEELYGAAEAALRGDPRPIRGRARTMEVLGDLDGAMKVFEQSIAVVESRRASNSERDYLSLAHERIRSLRHKITCLAAMHSEHPLATSEARRRESEIRRLIAISEPQHREALQHFATHEEWWRIEWFMAQVLHAKAWTAIKEDGKAVKRLEWSLDLRLQLISDEGPISAVELGNLHWWCSVAREARVALDGAQALALEALNDSVDRGDDRRTIKTLGRRFLLAGSAPWAS